MHRFGQRGAGDQVDGVVLAEVDEREPERAGVGPADRARDGIDLRDQARGHQRGGEVQRRHGSERIPSERIVKIVPAVPQNRSPYSSIMRLTGSGAAVAS